MVHRIPNSLAGFLFLVAFIAALAFLRWLSKRRK